MKIKSVLLGSAALATALSAQNLIQDALDAGLVAIPSDPKALTKAINEASPDAEKYPTTMAAYELGKRLYFDPRLSKSGIISCNTCHNLGLGGADGVPASTGHKCGLQTLIT